MLDELGVLVWCVGFAFFVVLLGLGVGLDLAFFIVVVLSGSVLGCVLGDLDGLGVAAVAILGVLGDFFDDWYESADIGSPMSARISAKVLMLVMTICLMN